MIAVTAITPLLPPPLLPPPTLLHPTPPPPPPVVNSVRTLYSYSSCNHVLLISSRFRVPFYLAVYLTHVPLQQLPPAEAGSLSSAVVNAVRNLYSFIFPTITFRFFLLIAPSSIMA